MVGVCDADSLRRCVRGLARGDGLGLPVGVLRVEPVALRDVRGNVLLRDADVMVNGGFFLAAGTPWTEGKKYC